MTKHRKVLNILAILRDTHPTLTDIYMEGSCIDLFLLLRQIFPEADAYWDDNHLITKIGKYYYDINGVIKNPEDYYRWAGFYADKRTQNKSYLFLKRNDTKQKKKQMEIVQMILERALAIFCSLFILLMVIGIATTPNEPLPYEEGHDTEQLKGNTVDTVNTVYDESN